MTADSFPDDGSCRYTEPGEARCGARAADRGARILLCTAHLALAYRLVLDRMNVMVGVAEYRG